jgi:hypothetical protein
MTYGPIDFFAIEFKTDQLTGETLPELLELVKKEIIRVIDLVIIQKAEAIEDNTTAALLLIENLWAIRFGEAAVRSGGRLLMFDRIPFEVINETLEIFAQAEGIE